MRRTQTLNSPRYTIAMLRRRAELHDLTVSKEWRSYVMRDRTGGIVFASESIRECMAWLLGYVEGLFPF